MNRSSKYNFYLPQNTDPISVSDFNYNFEVIDDNLITEDQSWTSAQKTRALNNIGAAAKSAISAQPIDYETLINNEICTTSYVTKNTYNSRKFSDYAVLMFVFERDTWIVGTSICPRNIFTADTGIACITDWDGTRIEYDVKYVSDTSASIKKITNDSGECRVRVYGLLTPSL